MPKAKNKSQRSLIINADELLLKSGFKGPTKKEAAYQAELESVRRESFWNRFYLPFFSGMKV